MKRRQFCVYILTNRSGTLYTGVTNDLKKRLKEHRSGKCAFTAKYRIGKLLYFEVTDSPYAAVSREREIKGWTRARKLALICSVNPPFRDLAPDYRLGSAFLFEGSRAKGPGMRDLATDPS